jgi:hypothetical protein
VVLAHDTDTHARDPVLDPCEIVGHRRRGTVGVAAIGAGNRLQDRAAVPCRPGEWADVVEAEREGTTRLLGTRPNVGIRPLTQQYAAGIRMLPAVSVPIAPRKNLAATPLPHILMESEHGTSCADDLTGRAQVGLNPLGIAITPDGRTPYVTNENGASVTLMAQARNTPHMAHLERCPSPTFLRNGARDPHAK